MPSKEEAVVGKPHAAHDGNISRGKKENFSASLAVSLHGNNHTMHLPDFVTKDEKGTKTFSFGEDAWDKGVGLFSQENDTFCFLSYVDGEKRSRKSKFVRLLWRNVANERDPAVTDHKLTISLLPPIGTTCRHVFLMDQEAQYNNARLANIKKLNSYKRPGRIIKCKKIDMHEFSLGKVASILRKSKRISYYIGRPGTGKTKAIASRIALLAERNPGARILVLSTSNVAVDHIVTVLSDAIFRNKQLSADRKRTDSPPIYVTRIAKRMKVIDERKLAYPNVERKGVRDAALLSKPGIGATTIALWEQYLLADKHAFLPYWDYIVIEEASAASKIDVFLAAAYCTKRLFLVGDPNQFSSITDRNLQKGDDLFQGDIFSLLGIKYRKDRSMVPPGNRQFDIQHRLPDKLDEFIVDAFYPDMKGSVDVGEGNPGSACLSLELESMFPDALDIWDISAFHTRSASISVRKDKMAGSKKTSRCNIISAAISVKLAHAIQMDLQGKCRENGHRPLHLSQVHQLCARLSPDGTLSGELPKLLHDYCKKGMKEGCSKKFASRLWGGQADKEKAASLLEIQDTVGIITPYRAQKSLMEAIRDDSLPDIKKSVSIDTINSYQGQERDVIIIDMVEADPQNSVSLLLDDGEADDSVSLGKLLNVAISRARKKCILIGDLTYFRNPAHYKRRMIPSPIRKILDYARKGAEADGKRAKGLERERMRFLLKKESGREGTFLTFWVASSAALLKDRQAERKTEWNPRFCQQMVKDGERSVFLLGKGQTIFNLKNRFLFKDDSAFLREMRSETVSFVLPWGKDGFRNAIAKRLPNGGSGMKVVDDWNSFDFTCVFSKRNGGRYGGYFFYGLVGDVMKTKRKGSLGIMTVITYREQLCRFFLPPEAYDGS